MGRPGGQIDPDEFSQYDQAVLQVVRQECGLSGLPVVTQMDFGHTDPMCVLPLGVRARIDSDRQGVYLDEPATTDTASS